MLTVSVYQYPSSFLCANFVIDFFCIVQSAFCSAQEKKPDRYLREQLKNKGITTKEQCAYKNNKKNPTDI